MAGKMRMEPLTEDEQHLASAHAGLAKKIAKYWGKNYPACYDELESEAYRTLIRCAQGWKSDMEGGGAGFEHYYFTAAQNELRRVTRVHGQPLGYRIQAYKGESSGPSNVSVQEWAAEILMASAHEERTDNRDFYDWVMAQLPAPQAKALSLHLHGMNQRDIGKAMGVAHRTAAKHLACAQVAIKELAWAS